MGWLKQRWREYSRGARSYGLRADARDYNRLPAIKCLTMIVAALTIF
jgi:hypothetical protein